MENQTPEQKLKLSNKRVEEYAENERKKNRVIYLIMAILPFIVLFACFAYSHSQKSLVTQINEAIKASDQATIDVLLPNVDDLETLDEHNETMLMVACEAGHAEMIEWLLIHEVDPNYAPSGAATPLELYCSYGYKTGADTLTRLLRAGASIKDFRYTSPIFCLGERLKWMTPEERDVAFEEILILYDKGDKLTNGKTTLFHYAAQYNQEELATELLKTAAGAHLLSLQDENGKTPYDLALANGSAAIQRLLRAFEEGIREEYENPGHLQEPTGELVDEEEEEDNLDELIAALGGLDPHAVDAPIVTETEPASE